METEQALRERLRGEWIDPEHPAYEAACAVHNGAIHRRPQAIVRCHDATDVSLLVSYARESGITLAVRGGGHSGAGLGTVEDGLVADLSGMRGLRVDPKRRLVRAEGGCRWGEVDHATAPFGLSVPAGVVSTTGVGGLTLGGGHGYLTRKYGLCVDNLVEADVVLADGRIVTASEDERPELFWALRGGGGNFGVVTSFLFRAHPVSQVYAGPILWPIEALPEVMGWYRELMRDAPDDLYAFFATLEIPPAPLFPAALHGRRVCGIILCHLGTPEDAAQVVERAHAFQTPLFEHHGPMPLAMLNALFDPLLPPGLQWHWKGHFVRELTDDAIAVHEAFGARLPTPLSTMHMYPIDGAAARVPPDATAFAWRGARWSLVIGGIDPDPAQYPNLRAWARDYWQALVPHSEGAGYLNFMQEQEEGEDRVRIAYRDNYPKLVAVKTQYDPTNLFHVNWNIPPRGTKPSEQATQPPPAP